MFVKATTLCAACLLIALATELVAAGGGMPTQRRGGGGGGNTCRLYSPLYAVSKPASLQFSGCTLSEPVSLPGVEFPVSAFDISGNDITVKSSDGTSKPGRVQAEIQSRFCINANVGLRFNQTDLPLGDPNWKAASFVSLRIVQLPAGQFTLSSAPGEANQFEARFTCQQATASSAR